MSGLYGLNWMDPSVTAATGGGSPFMPPGYNRWQGLADTLGSMGQALVAASAPSPYPQDFASVFGALGAGAGRGVQNMEDKYLKRAMASAQFALANEKVRQGQAWRNLFTSQIDPKAAPAKPDPTNPGGPSVSIGDDYYKTVGQAESGGDYTIPNAKGSGAFGKYQFMPATWSTVAQGNPSLNLPPDVTKATPEQQEAAMRAFTTSNAQALQAAGIPPTPQNLYLAHRFGVDGAKTVMGAAPTAQISSLFPANWTAQNPDMSGVTVGQFQTGVQQRFGGGATPVQYQPQQQPKTLQEVVQAMPPGVRQLVAAMGPEAGIKEIMKYADPETVPAFDPRTNQMVFVPKTALKSGGYQPVDAARFGLDQQRFGFDKEKFAKEQARDAEKFKFEKDKFKTEQGQKGQFVRGADGVQRWVPADQYAGGMPNYDKPPEPGAAGTETGDVATLNKAFTDPEFAKKPEYAAAYNRLSSKLIDGPGGIKYAPNMGAYPKPTTADSPPSAGAAPGLTQIGDRSYTESQNKDHTYGARLDLAIPQLERMLKDEKGSYTTAKLPGSFQRMLGEGSFFGVGAPEWMVSDQEKEFRRIIRDIMTSTLRRESGATIQESEFKSEAQKFIPLPGDSPQIVENKLNALKLAARTIAEASGRDKSAYPNLFRGQAAASGAQPSTAPNGVQFEYVPGRGLVRR